jgi:Ner family transcriptional regulator
MQPTKQVILGLRYALSLVIVLAMTSAHATHDMPTTPRDRREWISYQLRLRGLSFRSLARQEGVTHQAVSAAALGGSSRPLQEALADTLGIAPHALFPELYDRDGTRLGRSRAPQRTTGSSVTATHLPPLTMHAKPCTNTRINTPEVRHAV